MSDPTVVLVHGSFHGAWCFERVVAGLASRDVRAVAVDLPTSTEAPGARPDLHTDVARVRQVLDDLSGPVVLLGHSYGGAVITEAGAHPAVAHLVYLAALVPRDDETGGELLAAGAEPAGEGQPGADNWTGVDDDAVATMAPEMAAQLFYHDCDAETVAWALPQLRPQPLRWMGQRPVEVAWRTTPSTYLICANDQVIHPELQRRWAKRCTASVEWESGHLPFLSHPERLAGLLADLATH